MIRYKIGVKLFGIRPEIVTAINCAEGVYNTMHGFPEMVITSVVGGKHGYGSLHFTGCAFDIRTTTMDKNYRWQLVRNDIAIRLTKEFDVVLESDHIHIEFQPKVET